MRLCRANDLRRGKINSCGCTRLNKCRDRLRTLFFVEKQLGAQALIGLSQAMQMHDIDIIMKNAGLGSPPPQP